MALSGHETPLFSSSESLKVPLELNKPAHSPNLGIPYSIQDRALVSSGKKIDIIIIEAKRIVKVAYYRLGPICCKGETCKSMQKQPKSSQKPWILNSRFVFETETLAYTANPSNDHRQDSQGQGEAAHEEQDGLAEGPNLSKSITFIT